MSKNNFDSANETNPEIEALALAMKHSKEMQREVYNRQPKQEEIETPPVSESEEEA